MNMIFDICTLNTVKISNIYAKLAGNGCGNWVEMGDFEIR